MFRDREDAGNQLAEMLSAYRGKDAVVVALPRGGVPVAYEVAKRLRLPLDILVVRKLGAPMQEELGMGAVAEGGVRFINPTIVYEVGATKEQLANVIAREEQEVARRVARWRGSEPPLPLTGKIVIVVDDGIATGGTMRAALQALRMRHPTRIVLAVPVATISTLAALRDVCDDVICVDPEQWMWSIGAWYERFDQVREERVFEILARARAERADASRTPSP